MAEQEDKTAEGRVIFGNYILGAPEIERDQGNTEEGLQAAEEGSKATEGRNTAWSRMATTVKAKSRSARLTAADSDMQHRQRQLSKQREPKQDKARMQQGQEADHAKRREAAEAETNAEAEAWALALEEKAKPEAAERTDKVETRRLAKHKAKREGGMTLWRKAEKDAARKTAKQLQARIRQLASETAATFEFEV